MFLSSDGGILRTENESESEESTMADEKKQEIIVTGEVQEESGSAGETQKESGQNTQTVHTETKTDEKKRWNFSGFGVKKWVALAAAVLVVCGVLSLIFRVDLPRAQQIAQQAAGGQAQIISQEIDSDFLFFNEYSFELVTADGVYCEVELDAFGNVTSIEQEGWRR